MCYHFQAFSLSFFAVPSQAVLSFHQMRLVVTKCEVKLLSKNVLQVFPLSSCSSWKYSLPPSSPVLKVYSHMWRNLWYQLPMRHTCRACCFEIKHLCIDISFLNRDTTTDCQWCFIPNSRCVKHTLPCSDLSRCQRDKSTLKPVPVEPKTTEDNCSVVLYTSALELILTAGR